MTRWLDDFLALAETKQFSIAADKIYLSQPALSKHIKALEDEVGTALFSRNGAQVELTQAGEIYYEYALRIRDLERELQDRLAEEHLLSQSVHITLASIPCITESGIMKRLMEFERKRGNLTLECLEIDQYDCLRMLKLREIDVAICRTDFLTPREYDFIPLVSDELVLICPKDMYPYPMGSVVDLGAIGLRNVYTIAKESGIYRLAQIQLQQCGIDPSFAGTAHRHRMLLFMIASKGGCALLPQSLDDLSVFPGLTYYRIQNAVKTHIGLVRLAKKNAPEKTEMLFRYFGGSTGLPEQGA